MPSGPETAKRKQVTLTTDGACLGNPGPGGWAFILEYSDHRRERSGAVAGTTTSNRMELQAAIEGLQSLKEPCDVLLVSDSKYLLNGLRWMRRWKTEGWMTRDDQPVANSDLWQTLDVLASRHNITGQWVKGHNGHRDNERCNQLAEARAGASIPAGIGLDEFVNRVRLADWFASLPDE